MNAKFYQVGGSVRDKLLGLKSKDIDFAVEAESFDAMREAILARKGKIFVETPKYFTIRAHVPNLGATDYTLCRKDGIYKDGRHPESVTIGTIKDDLARRDFTVNAIAIDADSGEYIDPHDGMVDLAAGFLRCVGNPIDRFNEDKLRIFRALRFHVTRNFLIDPSVSKAIHEFSLPSAFDGISTERIREELNKMFEKDSFYSFHLLNSVFPVLGTLVTSRKIWFMPTTKER